MFRRVDGIDFSFISACKRGKGEFIRSRLSETRLNSYEEFHKYLMYIKLNCTKVSGRESEVSKSCTNIHLNTDHFTFNANYIHDCYTLSEYNVVHQTVFRYLFTDL